MVSTAGFQCNVIPTSLAPSVWDLTTYPSLSMLSTYNFTQNKAHTRKHTPPHSHSSHTQLPRQLQQVFGESLDGGPPAKL